MIYENPHKAVNFACKVLKWLAVNVPPHDPESSDLIELRQRLPATMAIIEAEI